MFLVLAWLCFILLMTLCEELDQLHYLLFSSSMLYLTYVVNKVKPFKITLRGIFLLLSIPNFLLGYVAFVYNDFLALNPISYECFIALLFIYVYVITYAFLENKTNICREKSYSNCLWIIYV